jgi:glycosyltransferase involved in cell wall biosynthesis
MPAVRCNPIVNRDAALLPARPDMPQDKPLIPDILIDVSRLVWRVWKGRLPTGVDRVCLAYVDHFGPRGHAVIQYRELRAVLTFVDSQALFALLGAGGPRFRRRLIALLAKAVPRGMASRPRAGALYLNIGHTGLDSTGLPTWIARHGLRAIHLIHDLIPINAPEFCRPGEAEKHRRRMTNALLSASGIIANSAVTLEDLQRFAVEQDLPCPPGIAAWLAGHQLPLDVAPIPADRPYFVTIGTIEGRKNHILLLRLWQRLVRRLGAGTPRLVIVGQRGWEAEHALAMLDRGLGLDGVVHEMGGCGDAELARLIKGARAVLMPSFTEGFGLPVVEALQLGTPVIASDLPVFREIAGNIPTYIASFDSVGWEQAIVDFCGNSPERTRQIEAIQSYHAPDWATHFAAVEQYLAALPERVSIDVRPK